MEIEYILYIQSSVSDESFFTHLKNIQMILFSLNVELGVIKSLWDDALMR